MKVDFRKIHNEKKIAVAVSGGIDSMALVLLAKKFMDTMVEGAKLTAITVDHGLRPSSTKEAKFVGKVMAQHGIWHRTLTWDGEKPEFNIEAVARKKRYELLTGFCKENGIKCLLVGHHAGDQAENFLIRLFRGSGIDGLASMKHENEINGIKILRPLLDVKKEELKDYLVKSGVKWIEDESNEDEKYLRNKIRKFLGELKDKDAIIERVNSAVNSIAKAKDIIKTELIRESKSIVKYFDEGYVELNAKKLSELDEELGLRLLAWVLMEISGNPYKPRFEKLKRIYDKIVANKLSKATTFYGCVLEAQDGDLGKIIIYREKNAIKNELASIGNGEFLWDNRFIVKHKDLNTDFTVYTLSSADLKQILKDCKKLSKIKGINKKILLTVPTIKFKDTQKEKILCSFLDQNKDLQKTGFFIQKKFITNLFK